MTAFRRLDEYLFYLILAITLIIVALLSMRVVINYANVNPFSRWVLTVRRWTDPLVEPVRRTLMLYGIGHKSAPLIAILLTLLVGFSASQFFSSLIATVANTSDAIIARNAVAAVGFVLHGLLSFYGMLLIIRVIFSWGGVYQSGPWMRRLNRVTDPVLVPLRRLIPPVSRFDLSPLLAFVVIWILQQVIAATMLRDFVAR